MTVSEGLIRDDERRGYCRRGVDIVLSPVRVVLYTLEGGAVSFVVYVVVESWPELDPVSRIIRMERRMVTAFRTFKEADDYIYDETSPAQSHFIEQVTLNDD